MAVELKRDIYGRPESDSVEKVNLTEAFASFDEHWSPRLAGELNGQAVKLAKAGGELGLDRHQDADEVFLVFFRALRVEIRDRADLTLPAGGVGIVSRGVEHRPVAEDEAEILLFEPPETRNTGNVETEQTRTGRETVD